MRVDASLEFSIYTRLLEVVSGLCSSVLSGLRGSIVSHFYIIDSSGGRCDNKREALKLTSVFCVFLNRSQTSGRCTSQGIIEVNTYYTKQ